MDHRAKLVVLALALFASGAHAGYAQLAPPSGFGGSAGNWTFAPSANQQSFGKVIYQNGSLRAPIPGTSVTMPAAYRLAANAPRIAAGIIFANPYIRTAVGIASWINVAGVNWDDIEKIWRETTTKPSSIGYWFHSSVPGTQFSSPGSACVYVHGPNTSASYVSEVLANCIHADGRILSNTSFVETASTTCPTGWTEKNGLCLSPAISQPVFIDKLNPPNQPWPMPETVPWELPKPTPLPVEQPIINPEPGPNPQPRPLFVPTGDPLPNPNYDPNAAPSPSNQPWTQPGVRVVPSPTPFDPWRVDLQPVNRPVPGPEPMPEPDSETPPNPDSPKSPDQVGLCELYPDILACQKLGTTEAAELPKNTVDMSIAPEGGFGPSSGVCPAPKTFQIMGKPMEFRWDLLCDFASQIRPLLIGFAWLSAALAFLGLSRRD